MATHTFGTAGDFSTPQAWEDDIPATLTEQRIGQAKNQEFTSIIEVVNFDAHATTSSFDIIMEAATGASFKDNANVRTNALRYNASNGAALRTTAVDHVPVLVSGSVGHLTIRNLQISNTGSNDPALQMNGGLTYVTIRYKDLILEITGANNAVRFESLPNTPDIRFDNCLIINRSAGDDGVSIGGSSGTVTFNGCTIVRPSNITAAGNGIHEFDGTTILIKNTVIAGFTADATSGNLSASSDYNATTFSDVASGLPDPSPDHNVYGITYNTALFVQPSDAGGTHDFRTLSASALEDVGIYDGTNTPADISGLTRNNPPEIGAWELGVAAAVVPKPGYQLGYHR